jgi:hypothetical protein
VNQTLVHDAKRWAVDSQSLGNAGPETFEGDVGRPCQRMDDLSPLFGFQVDGDAALVSIGAEKDSAKAGRRERRPAAGFVALSHGFHLDDVGTEIAEILGA